MCEELEDHACWHAVVLANTDSVVAIVGCLDPLEDEFLLSFVSCTATCGLSWAAYFGIDTGIDGVLGEISGLVGDCPSGGVVGVCILVDVADAVCAIGFSHHSICCHDNHVGAVPVIVNCQRPAAQPPATPQPNPVQHDGADQSKLKTVNTHCSCEPIIETDTLM